MMPSRCHVSAEVTTTTGSISLPKCNATIQLVTCLKRSAQLQLSFRFYCIELLLHLCGLLNGSSVFTTDNSKNTAHHAVEQARQSTVDEIGERYRLNHAIVIQAAYQAVVCGTMRWQAALHAALLQNTPEVTS